MKTTITLLSILNLVLMVTRLYMILNNPTLIGLQSFDSILILSILFELLLVRLERNEVQLKLDTMILDKAMVDIKNFLDKIEAKAAKESTDSPATEQPATTVTTADSKTTELSADEASS